MSHVFVQVAIVYLMHLCGIVSNELHHGGAIYTSSSATGDEGDPERFEKKFNAFFPAVVQPIQAPVGAELSVVGCGIEGVRLFVGNHSLEDWIQRWVVRNDLYALWFTPGEAQCVFFKIYGRQREVGFGWSKASMQSNLKLVLHPLRVFFEPFPVIVDNDIGKLRCLHSLGSSFATTLEKILSGVHVGKFSNNGFLHNPMKQGHLSHGGVQIDFAIFDYLVGSPIEVARAVVVGQFRRAVDFSFVQKSKYGGPEAAIGDLGGFTYLAIDDEAGNPTFPFVICSCVSFDLGFFGLVLNEKLFCGLNMLGPVDTQVETLADRFGCATIIFYPENLSSMEERCHVPKCVQTFKNINKQRGFNKELSRQKPINTETFTNKNNYKNYLT